MLSNRSLAMDHDAPKEIHHLYGPVAVPSPVFRTDLITAMKVHDIYQLNPDDYYVLADPWRQEWEKGVQVPVSPQSIPQPMTRVLCEKGKEVMFTRSKKLIQTSGAEVLGYVDIQTLAEGMCRYDLNEEDVAWLQIVNQEFSDMGMPPLDEMTMERVIEEFERRCHDNMTHAMETEEGLGIEYDEDVVCDICQSPDGEDNNEMVFCDKCNICVHQACYGIQKVPKGSWLCRICALGILPKCHLCPKRGGAMKPTRSGTKWVHVSCALWIPEVSIGNPEKMEPITNVSHIPSIRWALICCLCKEKTGACIQCSAKNCRTAFHVTCGLHASLEMNTLLTEEDDIKFKSYCPKHSGLEGAEGCNPGEEQNKKLVRDKKARRRGRLRAEEGPIAASVTHIPKAGPGDPNALSSRQQEEKRVNLRKLKLQELEEDFYLFVEVGEVAQHLKLPQEAVDMTYQYWKLKRKANFSQPLLTPKKDEEESLARREQEVLLRRLQLFTHLRQDLERVRNLTYMVTRREKIKRSLWRFQEQIFQHQVRLLDHELLTGDPSAKDLEQIFSLSRLSEQASHACSALGGQARRGSLKLEKSKSGHRKSSHESPHPDRKTGRTKALEPTDNEGTPAQACDVTPSSCEQQLHRPVSRSGPMKESGPKEEQMTQATSSTESDKELEERKRRKRRSVSMGTPPVQMKQRIAPKPLEKTLSIRLVDIRASDTDPRFASRICLSLDSKVPTNKANKLSMAPHSAITNKAHEWLRKASGPLSSSSSGHLKNWGKFRIPKIERREISPVAGLRKQEASEQLPPTQRKPFLRPLTNTPEYSYPRTRLRTGTEKDCQVEPCLNQCHSHQLRREESLGHHYGADIIHRGVLAAS